MRVIFFADRSRRSVSILLYVRYAPSVRLSTSQRPGLIKEGETIQFRCRAHANPPPLEYSWYVDGQRANGFNSDYFLIRNISKSYHNASVKWEMRLENLKRLRLFNRVCWKPLNCKNKRWWIWFPLVYIYLTGKWEKKWHFSYLAWGWPPEKN